MTGLAVPHGGGGLVGGLATLERAAELKAATPRMSSWTLTARQLCDLELLLNGGFSPLTGFLESSDHGSVCESMRLANGVLWPIPITLAITEEVARGAETTRTIALRDEE